jgi:hypothetical protein
MDESAVRDRAAAFCDAVAAGDIDRAIEDFSPELRQHLGEVVALLPLPANEVTVETVERGGSGINVVIRLAGETDEDRIQLRFKDRDGHPTIVEASHVGRTARAAESGDDGEAGDVVSSTEQA